MSIIAKNGGKSVNRLKKFYRYFVSQCEGNGISVLELDGGIIMQCPDWKYDRIYRCLLDAVMDLTDCDEHFIRGYLISVIADFVAETVEKDDPLNGFDWEILRDIIVIDNPDLLTRFLVRGNPDSFPGHLLKEFITKYCNRKKKNYGFCEEEK